MKLEVNVCLVYLSMHCYQHAPVNLHGFTTPICSWTLTGPFYLCFWKSVDCGLNRNLHPENSPIIQFFIFFLAKVKQAWNRQGNFDAFMEFGKEVLFSKNGRNWAASLNKVHLSGPDKKKRGRKRSKVVPPRHSSEVAHEIQSWDIDQDDIFTVAGDFPAEEDVAEEDVELLDPDIIQLSNEGETDSGDLTALDKGIDESNGACTGRQNICNRNPPRYNRQVEQGHEMTANKDATVMCRIPSTRSKG